MSSDRVAIIVERLGNLPALPKSATEVLRTTDDPLCDVGDIAHAIEQDPALAAKVVQISNSSYYGMRQFVGTLKLALVVLGVQEVRNIVTGVSVFDALGGDGGAGFQTELWEHSLLVAGIARQLDMRLGAGMPGEAFLAGLLHDIGKLAIERHEGGVYREIARDHGDDLCAKEREIVGFTHADAGAALASRWQFPLSLIDAIQYHHTINSAPLDQACDPMLAALVRIANHMSHDAQATTSDASLACADETAWCFLGKAPRPVADEERFKVLNDIVTALRKPPASLA